MNIGNPSPQEIFDSYSQIPNTAQGKQMLSQLAQAFKNSGDMRGSIATSILNSYNSQQAAPPPPQGQVVDQVVAQAEPPSWQQGIAAPGMAAPQGMAAGGLVAFANGGGISSPWDLDSFGLQAPDTSMYEADLAQQELPEIPEEEEETEELPVSRSLAPQVKAPKSFDSQLQGMMDLYGVPPDVAAELVSKREHNMAKRQKFNTFENIAAALGGYLSSYGTGAHRAGVGITSMLASMGQHEREDRADEEMLDALRMKSATMPYEFRKGLIDQLLAIEAAQGKADRAYREKVALKGMEQKGREDIEKMRGASAKEIAGFRAAAAGPKGQLTPAVLANLKAKAMEMAQKTIGYEHKGPEEQRRIEAEKFQQVLKTDYPELSSTGAVPQVMYTPASP